jgi:hypothetical protein
MRLTPPDNSLAERGRLGGHRVIPIWETVHDGVEIDFRSPGFLD